MILKKAEIDEAEDVLIFYKDVIKSIKNSDFKPKWNDKYPDLEYIEKSIKKMNYTSLETMTSSYHHSS